ncbi:uncharacterized protein LOC132302735 [Cornus florida]|uniref:uncharacterized protein LOC132302735 n=1 Tax=Cornus florida TaxID=4283 RepID=UPI0028983FEC|nr:uncharacterized protein LOC132302735 [Cornus florida]
MRGKGKPIGHSRPRTCSGRKALKRCKNIGKADNVVLIDVDGDNIDNVIIIDVPDSLPQKQQGSSVPREDKNCPLQNVICIDDDESADSNHLGIGVDGADNFHSDGSSSTRPCPVSNHSLDADGDECQFVQENISPIKISKCKRTYSGKASTRNRYGLNPEPESCSSDNDCPDSEFMEGSSGKLQEQWEKAFFKRKKGVCSGQSEASRSHTDGCQNVEVENMTEQRPKAPVCSSSSNASYEKEAHKFSNQGSFGNLPEHWKKNFCNGQSGAGNQASVLRFNLDSQQNVEVENMTDSQTNAPGYSSPSSPFTAAGDGKLGSTSPNPMMNSNADFDLKSTEETRFSWSKADVRDKGESFTADPPSNYAEWQPCRHCKHGVSCFCSEEKQSSRGPFSSTLEQDNEQVNPAKEFSHIKEKNPWAETCLSNSEPRVDINCGHSKASLMVDEVFSSHSQWLAESLGDHGRFVNRNKRKKFHQTASSSNELKQNSSSFADKEKSVSGEPSFRHTQSSDGTGVNHGVVFDDEVAAVSGGTFCRGPSLVKSGISNEKGFSQEVGKSLPEEPSFCNFHHNEAQTSVVPMSDSQQLDETDNSMNTQNGDVTDTVHSCLISKREKLKETDEYKRAIEEEWASRQRELQIQAEEAQQLRRLRKREKAESMRLLDMERRQKRRVEEIRETQKKDEENMNVKEQLRAEVRKELNKLEMACHDMASLLRGLGIDVSGGFHPLPNEVRVAYKRALLSFHPDRALKSDVRQLVEAEEKFKLISRMKEKFLL